MRRIQSAVFSSIGLLAISTPTWGQAAGSEAEVTDFGLEEIVVSARRRDELLQDVPTTVNVVTAEDLSKLSFRQFEEIQAVIPGLSFQGSGATVRGISFNQLVSGSNGTIDFYWNDAPVPATSLFQAMYDVGQIELLRGPQGTLRGRAAPSGSMTVTTRRPDLNEFGGYITTTGTDDQDLNVNGAINLPIIDGMLGVRVAALWEDTNNDGVESVNTTADPFTKVKSARATIRFVPTDFLSFNLAYQRYEREAGSFRQLESVQAIDPLGTPSRVFIKATDRLSAQDTPTRGDSESDLWNLQAQWDFVGQQLSYVGQRYESSGKTQNVSDVGDFFGPGSPAVLNGWGNYDVTEPKTTAHELRLSSEERLFGMLDYIVGGFYQELESPTVSNTASAVLTPVPTISRAALVRFNETKEQSFYGNLTLHLGEKTEISAGARRINYQAESGVIIGGINQPSAAQDVEFNTTIYTGSLKYDFTEDLMAYALVGTSWRPGITLVGDTNLTPSALELSFVNLPPEESTSYEIGMKLTALDRRMRFNLAAFHQKFDNFPYRPGTTVNFIETFRNTATTPPSTGQRVGPQSAAFNFAAAVPAEVNGVEAEWSFAATESWDMALSASYAKGEIDDGLIPCNDYSPRDGIPDTTSIPPSLATLQAAVGADNLSACVVNYRASTSPLFSASAQSEFRVGISSALDAYVRGLVSYYGDSQNDPTNTIDDVDAYALLNLYLGLRSSSGAWDVSLYGKNVTDTERVLSRNTTQSVTSSRSGAVTTQNLTGYRTVTSTEEPEYGLTLRWSFGSR